MFIQHRSTLSRALPLVTSLLLAACNSSDDASSSTPTSTSTSISGTAATGAPMIGAAVALQCQNNVQRTGITTNAGGQWSTVVPSSSLPCVVQVSDGTNTYFSITVGGGGSIVTNVTPLTSLALAQALGAVPDTTWFNALNNAGLQSVAAALGSAITALNAALANYAVPAGFNPFNTPLTPATAGQAGNSHDQLLEQLQAALTSSATSFASLLTTVAAGGTPTLPTPPRTPGATSFGAFFTAFAGDYSLKVSGASGEGTTTAAVTALFPLGSARAVHLKANGDVSIDAVGRTITFKAEEYDTDFIGTSSSQNQVRYRTKDSRQWLDLYITYDPTTGELRVSPQGFVNSEGYALLEGAIFVPPPAPPAANCGSGDDKLVFTDGPSDFCGFTRSSSANTIADYYQFTSTADSNGITYVKFQMMGTTVSEVTIENDNYAFHCGGSSPACTGASFSTAGNGSYQQFTLANTSLAVVSGATQPIVVNGLLIHPTSSGGSGSGAVGKAAARSLGDNAESARLAMVGEYDVAIYAAPTVSEAGKGKLVVAYTGGTFSLTLKNAAGTELVTRTANDTNCTDGRCISTEDNFPSDPAGVYEFSSTAGRRARIYNYYEAGNSTGPEAYFNLSFFSNGVIAGSTGGYYFRNDATAYGADIPGLFTALAGSYSGPAQQLLCNPNPVSVTISATGTITTMGKSSVSCASQNVTETWDGIQDLLVPDAGGGSKLVLNALNIGGSQPGGGHFVRLSSATPPQLTEFRLPFAGAAGDITSVALVKQ